MSSTVAAREYRVRSISGSGSVSLANEGRGDWISRSVEAVGQWILARCREPIARHRHQTHRRRSRNLYGSTGRKPASRTMPESRSCCILKVVEDEPQRHVVRAAKLVVHSRRVWRTLTVKGAS